MNAKVKKRWLAALRSGEYRQGKSVLRKKLKSGEERFCCLGVLCDTPGSPGKWKSAGGTFAFVSDFEDASGECLTDAVAEWADLGDLNPSVVYKGKCRCLAELNDTGVSFKTIARLIEEQL